MPAGMSFQSGLLLFALALALIGIAAVICRLAKRVDFFVMTLFGKPFAFRNPIRENSYGIAAPFIRPVNEFLVDFANSAERQIEFTPDDFRPSSTAPPLLRALQGMDYERIRLRLRVISSLNPTVNLKTEEGLIQFTCHLSSGAAKQVKLRSQFAPKGQAILLEKL
jgi:hypothetical protein